MDLEGWIKHLKQKLGSNVPDIVTKENVNELIQIWGGQMTLLKIATNYDYTREKVIPQLLELGATITYNLILNSSLQRYFLEMGADVNQLCPSGLCVLDYIIVGGSFREGTDLIDYNAKPKNLYLSYLTDDFDLRSKDRAVKLHEYSLLSDKRVQECRKALLALIRVCKGSKSLRGLKGVILEMAKQVWSIRGPTGGPRGHLWILF
jgi:hypothetical protein